MRYLLLILLLLLPTVAFGQTIDPGAFDEVHEQGLLAAIMTALTGILTLGGWMVRTWWKARLENKHKKRVEKRLEQEWSNGDETLSGAKNPGRTQAQLTEVVHEDLQQHKTETNRRFEHMDKRFDAIHGDLGKIKGKLDIN